MQLAARVYKQLGHGLDSKSKLRSVFLYVLMLQAELLGLRRQLSCAERSWTHGEELTTASSATQAASGSLWQPLSLRPVAG